MGARVRLGDLPAVDAQPRARRSVLLLVVAEDNRLHGPPSRASFFGQVDFFRLMKLTFLFWGRNPAPETTLLVPGARFAHKDLCLRAA